MENSNAKYLSEFPDFDYKIPAIPGMTDTSWHNDACPTFTAEDRFLLQLFCDYIAPEKREMAGSERRFSLYRTSFAGGDPVETLAEEEDFGAILIAYFGAIKKRLTGPGFFRAWLGERYKEKVGYNPFEDSPKIKAREVVDMLVGVLVEEFKALNEADIPEGTTAADLGANAEPDEPEFPEIDEMIDAIRASEKALAEGQLNCAGNDLTEGEECDEETIFFMPLVLCRNVLASYERASKAVSASAEEVGQ
jgi:hypothetical protein